MSHFVFYFLECYNFTMKKIVLAISLAGLVLTATIGQQIFKNKFWKDQKAVGANSPLGPITTEGNKILVNGKSIRLKGAISDFFRYKNSGRPASMEEQFKNLRSLKNAGANIVGLYLDDFLKIKERVGKLDKYIDYANANDMYIFLAPVGREFREGKDSWLVKPNDINDLTQLITFLASRYKNNPGVLYQLAAEPETQNWDKKQQELINVVRKYTDNPIILSSIQYGKYFHFPKDNNLIYALGGYTRSDDSQMWVEEPYLARITEGNLKNKYPTLVEEFGGNYGKDFSSERDLNTIEEILEEIDKKSLSFTGYRIGPNFKNDPLSLFDDKGEFTKRGKLLFKYLKDKPSASTEN